MALRLFYLLSVVMTMVPTLLSSSEDRYRSKRLSQILFVCWMAKIYQWITVKKAFVTRTSPTELKKPEKLQQKHRRRRGDVEKAFRPNCKFSINLQPQTFQIQDFRSPNPSKFGIADTILCRATTPPVQIKQSAFSNLPGRVFQPYWTLPG